MDLIFFITIFVSVFSIISPVLTQRYSKRPIPIFRDQQPMLLLPNNATAIRENIVDTFSCENRIYGYYADVDNECQVFHVCLPQARGTMRWSFICPLETVFNQATFVCTRINESIPCEESEQYYVLNEEIGKEEEKEPNPDEPVTYYPLEFTNELPSATPFSRNFRGKGKIDRRGKSKNVVNDKNNSTDNSKTDNFSTTLRSNLSHQRLKK